MKFTFPKIHNLIFIFLILTSCSTSKLLEENQNLLGRYRLFVNGNERANDPATKLLLPKPNTLFLGYPLKLKLNSLVKESPKENFQNWLDLKPNRRQRLNKLMSKKQVYQLEKYAIKLNSWLNRNGEKAILVDTTLINSNSIILNQYYKNLGYFDVISDVDINKLKSNFEEIVYNIDLKELYTIGNILEEIEPNELEDLYIDNKGESFLKNGDAFTIQSIENERDRLLEMFRNNGVYNFQQNSLQFIAKIDSSKVDKNIDVLIKVNPIKRRINDSLMIIPYKKFRVQQINIYIEPNIESEIDTYNFHSLYNDVNIYSKEKLKYKEKSITDPIFIKINDWYSDKDRELTYRYFNSLKNFKYPSITYKQISDSTLSTSIFLTPKERFSLGLDLDLSHSNIQDIGMGFGITSGIRNIFNGTEILDFGVKSMLGASRNSANPEDKFFNLFELGGDINIKFPKIIFPISLSNFIPKEMNPSTQLSFGTTLQENIGLDKQYFGSTFEYQWKPNSAKQISFKLVDFEFVNNKNVQNYFNVYKNSYDRLNEIAKKIPDAAEYLDNIGNLVIPNGANLFIKNVQNNIITVSDNNDLNQINSIRERQERLTVNNLILGSSINFNLNNQESLIDEEFYQLKFKFEWVGSVLNKFLELTSTKNNEGKYQINGVSPSQYIKSEIDYIRHFSVGRERIFAFRIFGGMALPIGNSINIPFSRSYFAGGANDNRAWKAYKLGPGTTDYNNEFNEANFKISANFEYRFPFIGPIKGALFIDSGNIWNIGDNVTDSRARFEKISDLSEIAIGTGFGIRYDFDFFVFRFDTGFKTYNPSLESNRWLSEFGIKHAVFNIGINYPF
ncbi:MAG: hypothetical protein CMC79_00720 [Flavobacteriaceae bacterium]|nr:hypothetical protein [Flavobacteriaceae bacterium]